jgi:hypothetical protein
VNAAARAALLRKYRLLARWRRAKDRSVEVGEDRTMTGPEDDPGPPRPEDGLADREAMRALATEFPGVLRELDRLGAVEIERRVSVLSRLEASGADDSDSDGGDDGGDEPWIAWIVAYHELMRQVLADKRAGTAARAPEGRASIGVLRALEARFGLPAEEIGAALFPPRRRVPPGGR